MVGGVYDMDDQPGALRELSLFAGAGGGILGGVLLGWRTVCAVEIDPYAASVLIARQNDGTLAPFPVWSDVRTFAGIPWRGLVDVVSGGFPCQDISAAGKGAGLRGARSGLWREMARVVGEVRPRFVFIENSPLLTSRGLDAVFGDLAALGFNAEWDVFGARHVGAPHKRDRIWVLAYAAGDRWEERWTEFKGEQGRFEVACGGGATAHVDRSWQQQSQGCEQEQWRRISNGASQTADADGARLQERKCERCDNEEEQPTTNGCNWWAAEPGVGRMVYGVPTRMDRIKALGNAQVPAVAAFAWCELMRRIVNE